ncbi:MAG TPA: hypothetical protein VFL61_00455 [Gaiellaceae bacterium]|nr:hypothetical protein [Gaiellaceae bacterium]
MARTFPAAAEPPHVGGEHLQSAPLVRCRGYRVDAPGVGRIGFVQGLRSGARSVRALAVSAGLSSRRLLIVPAAEIEFVDETARRIVLRRPVRLAATEPSPALEPEGWELHDPLPRGITLFDEP